MPSRYLSGLSAAHRSELEKKLLATQQGVCFICEEPIDYEIQRAHLDIDHIQPLADQGKDEPTNFALAHANCNRSKQAADLRVARVMARFAKIQRAVHDAGRDAPNLGDVLAYRNGARHRIQLVGENKRMRYAFSDLKGMDGTQVHDAPLYLDPLSRMHYFFALVPIEYLHHDERINPRGIGTSLRGLVEEFLRRVRSCTFRWDG